MIIAVDFDGILCKNDFPNIGEPNVIMITLIKELIHAKHEVILWTSRVEDELDKAIKWCHEQGLCFSAINENAPSNRLKYQGVYSQDTRKIYADIYIDDHSIGFLSNERKHGYGVALLMEIVEIWRYIHD